jgi:hypothetical protein
MWISLRLAATASLFLALAGCQCGPPTPDTCDPARCSGCCINGRCTSCGITGGGTTGGGNATGGGTGGGTTGGGTSTGGGTATGGGTGVVDFDGGWVLPTFPRQPALTGDGGTTVVIGTGADQTSSTKFGGTPDLGATVSVVYPPSGVMLPPNTNSIEFHFIPAAGQTLFRFTFQAPTTTLRKKSFYRYG